MIFLDQVQGRRRLRTVSSVGEVFPLTTTANGRACLALLAETEAKKHAGAEWSRLGIEPDWPALSKHLAKARATGLAEDLDNHSEGICALGMAFTDLAGDLHAISVPVPTPRYEGQREAVARALLAVKSEVSRMFGGRPDGPATP